MTHFYCTVPGAQTPADGVIVSNITENIDSKPNITMVEVKPKVAQKSPRRSPREVRSPAKKPSASPIKPVAVSSEERQANENNNNSNSQLAAMTGASYSQPAATPGAYDLESDMSPSEIVKLRKRGKKTSIDSLKRIISPEKSNKRTPAKRSPRKSPAKATKSPAKGTCHTCGSCHPYDWEIKELF